MEATAAAPRTFDGSLLFALTLNFTVDVSKSEASGLEILDVLIAV